MFGEEFHGDEDISNMMPGLLENAMKEQVVWNKEQAVLQAISNSKNRLGSSRYIAKRSISTGKTIMDKINKQDTIK